MKNSNLDDHPEMEKFIGFMTDFRAVLYRKGYHNRFVLKIAENAGRELPNSLGDCLRKFLSLYIDSDKKLSKFALDTYVDYNHADKNIRCEFQVTLDKDKGFEVKEMLISQKPSGERKLYRLDHNSQIQGAVAVQGLFPKPKPWDNHLKGKFRL